MTVPTAAAKTTAPKQASTLTTTAPGAAPMLTYTCFTNGNISINTSNLNGYHRITIKNASSPFLMSENKTAAGECEKELSTISNPVTLTGCALEKPVYIYVMKETIKHIYGGKDIREYIISCKLPAGGVTKTIVATAKVKTAITAIPITQTQIPTMALNMTITPSADVVVGQQLALKIVLENIQSPSKYYVLPETCTASSDASQNSHVQLLVKGNTEDAEIMTNFHVTTGSANATLYAFRFLDSGSVTIQCKVHICGDVSCNSKFSIYKPAKAPGTHRKRRAAAQIMAKKMPPTSTRVVEAMFTVKDGEKPTSGQSAVSNSFIAMFILLQLQRIWRHSQ